MAGHGEPIGHMLDDMAFLGAIALGGNSLIQPWLIGLPVKWAVAMFVVAAILFGIGLKINTKPSFWAWLMWEAPKSGGGHH